MQHLFAPWRMAYIDGESVAPSSGCIFCDLPKVQDRRESLVLLHGEHAGVMLNKYPYSNGHLLVFPAGHVGELSRLADPAATQLHRLLQISCALVKEVYRPQGMNVGMNIGRVAGAGVPDHMHYHIVPRWSGDANFMPVMAEVKVLPEHVAASFDRLAGSFAQVAQEGIDQAYLRLVRP